jgi:hypothetical protein
MEVHARALPQRHGRMRRPAEAVERQGARRGKGRRRSGSRALPAKERDARDGAEHVKLQREELEQIRGRFDHFRIERTGDPVVIQIEKSGQQMEQEAGPQETADPGGGMIQPRGEPERDKGRQQNGAVIEVVDPKARLEPLAPWTAELGHARDQQQHQRELPEPPRSSGLIAEGEPRSDDQGSDQRSRAGEAVERPIGGRHARRRQQHGQDGPCAQPYERIVPTV